MRQEMAGEGDHAAFVAVGEVAMRGFGLHRGADSVGRTVQDDGRHGDGRLRRQQRLDRFQRRIAGRVLVAA